MIRRNSTEHTSPTWSTKLPLLLSCGVLVLLAITALPGIRAEPPSYDALTTLNALTVVGLVWTAYFAARALQYQKEHDQEIVRSRRRALSKAMQVELNQISDTVSDIAKVGASFVGLEHPLLDRAMETPEVFQLQTIYHLADVIHQLESLGSTVRLFLADKVSTRVYSSIESGVPQSPPYARTERLAKDHAAVTAEAIKALRKELMNEMAPTPDTREAEVDASNMGSIQSSQLR